MIRTPEKLIKSDKILIFLILLLRIKAEKIDRTIGHV